MLILFFSTIIFINLGKFVDVTKKPVKSDIIVSLGGDTGGSRIKTALKLYQNGFSKSGKFIYTEKDSIPRSFYPTMSRRDYLEHNGVQSQDIVHVDETVITNTMEEIFFIKMYMLQHNLKSVIFVSHPHHSRRISTLAKAVADYNEAGLQLITISCNPEMWNREHYYKNKTAVRVTLIEIGKLCYNLIKYGTPLINYTLFNEKIQSGMWKKELNLKYKFKISK